MHIRQLVVYRKSRYLGIGFYKNIKKNLLESKTFFFLLFLVEVDVDLVSSIMKTVHIHKCLLWPLINKTKNTAT